MNLRHQAVGAYRRWTPPSFDDPAPEKNQQQAADSSSDAAQSEPQVKLPTVEEIERLHEETRATAQKEGFEEGHKEGFAAGHEEGVTAGYQKGFEEGMAKGLEAGKENIETQTEQLKTLLDNLDQALTKADDELAQSLFALATEIARKMVQDTLTTHPETILNTIHTVLHQIPQTHVQIALHPDDLHLVRTQLKDTALHFIEDDTILRGGCRIESSSTQIDATLETRWRRIMNALGQENSSWTEKEDE